MATTEMATSEMITTQTPSDESIVGLAVGLAAVSLAPGVVIVIVIITIIVCVMTTKRSNRLSRRTRDTGKCNVHTALEIIIDFQLIKEMTISKHSR